MDPAYWQTVAQWQQAEEEELAEYMRWHEEYRDRLNHLNCENDHEHSDIDPWAERHRQEQQPPQHGPY
ncbi:hypothetical protein GCM10009078_51910 [Cupriavidus gilardii]